jgi:acid phosphatase family membrane protein YuiD
MFILTWLREWQVLGIPITVMIISQVVKVCIDSQKMGWQWKHLNSYGGMPSSHTALCVSLMVMVGLTVGWTTPLFAVSAVMSAVFIRDASGIRWSLGDHGKILNKLIHILPPDEQATLPHHLEERLGHRPIEIAAGAVLGMILTLLLYAVLQ